MGQPTDKPVQANEEREAKLTQDSVNLWNISLREDIWREALRREVP